jgi:TraM recognition site of TraD and TraG
MAAEAVPAIQNKVGQFTANPLIRNMIGQPTSSFDFRQAMDQGKIIIINLSKGRIGDENMKLLGGLLVTKIYLAAMSRADVPDRVIKMLPHFYLFVDEFQNFANASFADILSESRKYKLNLTIAHQYIEQMDETVSAAVFGNVGTMIVFRVGATDAEALEKEFAPQFTMEDLVNLGQFQMYLKLMINGLTSAPFSATSMPPIPAQQTTYVKEIIDASREQFASPRAEVEVLIEKFHEATPAPTKTPPKAPLTGDLRKSAQVKAPVPTTPVSTAIAEAPVVNPKPTEQSPIKNPTTPASIFTKAPAENIVASSAGSISHISSEKVTTSDQVVVNQKQSVVSPQKNNVIHTVVKTDATRQVVGDTTSARIVGNKSPVVAQNTSAAIPKIIHQPFKKAFSSLSPTSPGANTPQVVSPTHTIPPVHKNSPFLTKMPTPAQINSDIQQSTQISSTHPMAITHFAQPVVSPVTTVPKPISLSSLNTSNTFHNKTTSFSLHAPASGSSTQKQSIPRTNTKMQTPENVSQLKSALAAALAKGAVPKMPISQESQNITPPTESTQYQKINPPIQTKEFPRASGPTDTFPSTEQKNTPEYQIPKLKEVPEEVLKKVLKID